MAQQAVFYYLLACTLNGQTARIRFYRFYFFVFAALHIQMYCEDFSSGLVPIILHIDMAFTIMASLGLFLLAAQKALFKPIFWKAYFFIYTAWDFFLTVIQKQIIPIYVIQRMVFLLPLYIALYLYAFRTTRKGNKCLLSGKEWRVPAMLKKVIKYGAVAIIFIMAAGLTYLIFFQTRINEPWECMYKPRSDANAIYSAIADYYAIPDRTEYPPSISELCNEGILNDLCKSFPSIEAFENSTSITMVDEYGIETTDISKGRKQVIRIHYPDCKCPREIQTKFSEWVDDCVYQETFN